MFLQPVTKHVVPSLSFLSSFSGSDIGNNLAPNCTGSLNCVSHKNIVNILIYFLSNILFKMIFFLFFTNINSCAKFIFYISTIISGINVVHAIDTRRVQLPNDTSSAERLLNFSRVHQSFHFCEFLFVTSY